MTTSEGTTLESRLMNGGVTSAADRRSTPPTWQSWRITCAR